LEGRVAGRVPSFNFTLKFSLQLRKITENLSVKVLVTWKEEIKYMNYRGRLPGLWPVIATER
jgi:hypothetical protein